MVDPVERRGVERRVGRVIYHIMWYYILYCYFYSHYMVLNIVSFYPVVSESMKKEGKVTENLQKRHEAARSHYENLSTTVFINLKKPAWWQSCLRRCFLELALSALCHWGFDSCASFEFERWREFILKAKSAVRRVV